MDEAEVAPAHEHEWRLTSEEWDESGSVRTWECACGSLRCGAA